MRKPQTATIISLAALFFSMTGAGVAATHYLITSTSQISPHVRHALKGDRGPRGATGTFKPGSIHYVTGPNVTASCTGQVPGCPHGNNSSFAACPGNSVPIAGGFNTSDPGRAINRPTADATLAYSYPLDTSDSHGPGPVGWTVSVLNTGGQSLTYWAYAVCEG